MADAKEPYQKRLVKVLRQFDRAGRTEVEKRHAVRAVAEDICLENGWDDDVIEVLLAFSYSGWWFQNTKKDGRVVNSNNPDYRCKHGLKSGGGGCYQCDMGTKVYWRAV